MSERPASSRPKASAAAVSGVAQALRDGDIAAAISLACAALDRGEIHPLFLNLRASRLEQEGQDRAALADLLRAHALDPNDAHASNALGLALAKADKPFEAIKAYDAALAVAPQFAPAQFNKAWACEAVGYLDAAKQCYETAIIIDPRFAEPFARLASLAARRGDFTETVRMAQEALQRQPDHPTALQAIAAADLEIGDFEGTETHILGLLARKNLSDFDRYFVMGLLADLRERQGRFAESYVALESGNNEYYVANRPRFGGPITAVTAIKWLIDYYSGHSGGTTLLPATTGSQDFTHVFLVGFPRSGTTLLEQALAAHPDVETMEEKDAFDEPVRAFMTSPADHAKLATLNDDQRAAYRERYWERVRSYGYTGTRTVFIDKLPFHTVKLPLIAALFPNARILFAIRDPRDVVLSCIRARFRINPYMFELLRPQDAAAFYALSMSLAEAYRRALPLAIKDIRHEDLVADFDGVCRNVCNFLGIEWRESMRDFSARQRMRAVATPSARQLAQGLSRAGIGRWKNYSQQLAPLMPVLAPWVRRFGYAA
ncbi:MAG TPA: sulfotransferase [Rhizomicrobium sp.]|jgi:tetratricopeptide (TPR) repeat protein|nr:sulfotransferase [Rhizomicrobium sp.]